MFFAFCSSTLCFSHFFFILLTICLDSQKDTAITCNTTWGVSQGVARGGSAWIHWGIPMWPTTTLPRTLWSRSVIYSGWWWFLKQIHSRTTRSVERCCQVERCVQPVQPPGWFSWLLIFWDFVGDYDHKEGNTTVHSIRIGHRVSNLGPGQTLVGAAEENCASFSGTSNGYSVLEIKTRCFFLKLVVGGGLKCDLIRHSQHHGCSMRTDVSMFPTHFADL